ncbi:MAG: MAPEG family protein [Proteobacteria bacterium]|nr:MAPEG family protein [Pseudomonadota bacterium]
MPAELELLGVAVIIGLLHLFWAAAESQAQRGYGWAAGPRDEPRAVTGRAARLNRAFANYLETLPLFAAAVGAAAAGDQLGALTFWGAHAYVWSRALYVPAYAFGWPVRPLLWFISIGGLIAVTAAIFI